MDTLSELDDLIKRLKALRAKVADDQRQVQARGGIGQISKMFGVKP